MTSLLQEETVNVSAFKLIVVCCSIRVSQFFKLFVLSDVLCFGSFE